jgi:hypothetical protein
MYGFVGLWQYGRQAIGRHRSRRVHRGQLRLGATGELRRQQSKTAPLSRSKTARNLLLTSPLAEERPQPFAEPRTRQSSPRELEEQNVRIGKRNLTYTMILVVLAALTLLITPDFRRVVGHASSVVASLWFSLPHADPNKFTVFVAELADDQQNTARNAIVIALQNTEGITIQLLSTSIAAEGSSEVEVGEERARKYLKQSGAELLIWGALLPIDGHETVHLYFTTLRTAGVEDLVGQYELQPSLIIDPSFWGDLVDSIRLAVVSSATTTAHDNCSKISQQLKALIEAVSRSIDGAGAQYWPTSTRMSVRLSLARALINLGFLTGKREPFQEAVELCRSAIAASASNSKTGAAAEVLLAASLSGASQFDAPSEAAQDMTEASENNRLAIRSLTPGKHQATAQLMLGLDLIRLSSLGDSVKWEKLHEGLVALQAARDSLDQKREPWLWNMATLFHGVGQLVWATRPGDHRVELAETELSLNESLKLMRDQDPSTWALTQLGLGSAHLMLGLRPSKPEEPQLRQAVEGFEKSLTVATRSCSPIVWALDERGLGRALSSLGETTGSIEDLRQGESAFRSELSVHTDANFPEQWAEAQLGLSEALRLQGVRRRDAKLVCQAFERALVCGRYNSYCAKRNRSEVYHDYSALMCNFDLKDRSECENSLLAKSYSAFTGPGHEAFCRSLSETRTSDPPLR